MAPRHTRNTTLGLPNHATSTTNTTANPDSTVQDPTLVTPTRFLRNPTAAAPLDALGRTSPGLITRLFDGDYNPFEVSFRSSSSNDNPNQQHQQQKHDESSTSTTTTTSNPKQIPVETPSDSHTTSTQQQQPPALSITPSSPNPPFAHVPPTNHQVNPPEQQSRRSARSAAAAAASATASSSKKTQQTKSQPTKRKRTIKTVESSPTSSVTSTMSRPIANNYYDNVNPSSMSTTSSHAATVADDADDPEAKRLRTLERNRLAALRCRQRKKEWEQSLEEQSILELSRNRQLHFFISQLSQQIESVVNTIEKLRQTS